MARKQTGNLVTTGVIDLGIYPMSIEVRVVKDFYEDMKSLNESYNLPAPSREDFNEVLAFIVYKPTVVPGTIFLYLNPDSDVPTIVHECIHTANRIVNKIDYSIDPNNDEPYAYLVDYIFKKVYEIFNSR